MLAKNLLRVIFFCAFSGVDLVINCDKEKPCKTSRIIGLKTSDCYKLDLKKIPTCLPSTVEVVELSYNRIRKVEHEDLQRYPYITHLYLTDNLIAKLDDDTFKDSTSLETLDLSINGIIRLPPTIFQLPTLKTLYLSQNMNINVAESIENAKPILQSTLTKLDISYITEDGATADFPDFNDLPLLAFLNISGDQFTYLSPRHFAGLCNLQILVNINVTAEFENDCDCWKINRWLTDRKVQFSNFLCPTNGEDCMDQQIESDDLEAFNRCLEKFRTTQRALFMKKIWMWIGIAVLFVLLVSVFVGYRKWKKFKQNRQTERRSEVLIAQDLGGEIGKIQFQLLKKQANI